MRYNNYESEDLLKENFYLEIKSFSKDTVEIFSEITDSYSADTTLIAKGNTKYFFVKIDNEYILTDTSRLTSEVERFN